MTDKLGLPDAIGFLRAWLNSDVTLRCDGAFFGVSFCLVGRLIGVEMDTVALLSADARAELAFDPRAAERFERGPVVGTASRERFGVGITAFLPGGNTVVFSLADPPEE